ncbi:MAG: SusC/RagA family TonB-linked outer membrane protein [Chitinophagaceae bacterium]|nr:MAG: SusC/RagA family TonB-linked outer membrane protein [Chitinophagaceae bacterium]
MRISCTQLLLALVFAGITYARNSNAQVDLNQRIDLSTGHLHISNILEKIEKITHTKFVYSLNVVNVSQKATIHAENEKLRTVLDLVLVKNGIRYDVINNRIVLSPIPDSQEGAKANLFLPATLSLYTSALEVHGKVTDDKGNPLVGVTVQVKNTNIGTVTNANGEYTVHPLTENDTLVFSYIGYSTRHIAINGRSDIIVRLQSSASGLNEVVVIGYGTQKKKDLTGSVISLTSKELNSGGTISNVAQAIQGKAAGVQVIQNSGAPGGSISIRIRGNNSINSSNEPLYVVDGFPTTNGLDINPDDIASLQILKGASATAIYGSRGANGVVLITTKHGRSGENTISYNGYTGVQVLEDPFQMLDGKQYMTLSNALYAEIPGNTGIQYGVYTPSQLQSNVNTNWVKETTRLGNVQSHNLQFQGGGNNTNVFASLGYFNQDGVLKNTNYNRISGMINVNQTINKYVKAGASLYAQRENSNVQQYGGSILNSNVLYSILTYDPTVPAYNPDGSFGRPPGGKGDNPLANLVARQFSLQNDKLDGHVFLEIDPITGLQAKIDGAAEVLHGTESSYLPKSTYQGSIDNGDAGVAGNNATHQLFDAYVTYTKDLGIVNSFSIMGGYSYEKFTTGNSLVNVYGFSTDLFSFNNLGAASTISGVSSSKAEHLLISAFGRLNYSYKDKYLFTFTLRRDGSSRFGQYHRWGTFPSGAFAWRMDQEPFIQKLNIFSNLKLRAGVGETGNESIGDYPSYGLVSTSHMTYDGSTSSVGTVINSGTPANPDLKWESTTQYDLGLDMGFFDSRLSLTMDAYYKKTTNLLVAINLPLYSGYTSGESNIGAVSNKGFELSISSHNLTGQLKWDTRVNFSLNRNKVLSLGGQKEIYLTSAKPVGTVSEEDYAVIKVGEPLGSLFGYVYDGVIQSGEKYAPEPNAQPGDPKFKDISGPEGKPDGQITSADRTIIGQAYPKFTYGITNTFTYKNFDLSIFAYGSVGNDLLNMTRMNLEWKRTTDALNRWTPTHTNTDIPRNGFFYSLYGGYINSHFIENASFLRLENMTFGYTIPVARQVIKSLRVYGSVQNLFTLTKYTGWNPEVSTAGYENDPTENVGYYHGLVLNGSNYQAANGGAGLDFNSYPTMRAFTFGLNVTF